MRSRVGASLIAILLIFSVGGHWAFLQSVAWVSMVMDFSKEAPLSIAIQKTFDGNHPCKLCKVVRSGKSSEQKQEATKSKLKGEYWLAQREAAWNGAPVLEQIFTEHQFFFGNRGESPPVPPPRGA